MTSIRNRSASHLCPDCPPLSPKFDSYSSLLHHIHEAHPFPKRFRCDDCGKAYARSWSLSSHKRACMRPPIPDFDTFSVFSASDDGIFCASPTSERSFSLIDDVINNKTSILDPPRSRHSRRSSKCSEDSQNPIICDTLSVNCLDLNRLQVSYRHNKLALPASMKRAQRNFLESLVSAEIKNKMAMSIGSLRSMRCHKKESTTDESSSDLPSSGGCDNVNISADEKPRDSIERDNHKWIAAIIASWIEELCLAIILKRALFIAFLLLCIHALEQLVPSTFKFNNIVGVVAAKAVAHMSYLVPISIVVLWGVCWMFARPTGPESAESQFEAAFAEFTCGGDYDPHAPHFDSYASDRMEMEAANVPSFGTDFTLFNTIKKPNHGYDLDITVLEDDRDNVYAPTTLSTLASSESSGPTSQVDTSSPNYSSATSQGSNRSPVLESHSGRSFTCDVCGQAFGHKTSLNRHRKNKHGNAEVLCPVPGCRKIMREDNLKRHVETVHPVSFHDFESLSTRAKKRRVTICS